MKNLELKIQLTKSQKEEILDIIEDLSVDEDHVLDQTDTYYKQNIDGDRLKIRYQKTDGKDVRVYAIRYARPNTKTEKISEFFTYDIGKSKKSLDEYKQVFKGILIEEIKVEKCRHLLIIKNARIHIDHVVNLGFFIEIEVILDGYDMDDSNMLMNTLKKTFKLDKIDPESYIKVGYRELLLNKIQK